METPLKKSLDRDWKELQMYNEYIIPCPICGELLTTVDWCHECAASEGYHCAKCRITWEADSPFERDDLHPEKNPHYYPPKERKASDLEKKIVEYWSQRQSPEYLVFEKFGQEYPLPSKDANVAKFKRYEEI